MSALLDIDSTAQVPRVSPDILRVPLPQLAPRLLSGVVVVPPQLGSVSLRILISDFNLLTNAALVDLRQDQQTGELSMRVAIDANVEARIGLSGNAAKQEGSFEIKEVSLHLVRTDDCAQADFVSTTLNAALVLSQQVRLQAPEMQLDLGLSFHLPLGEISRLLQSRQTSYWLTTIERATGFRFNLPQGAFSGDDIAAITFVFRAIVDRVFTYHLVKGIDVVVEANEEGAQRLRSLQEGEVRFGPEQVSPRLLGVEVPLGRLTVRIQDPYIENFDRAYQEVSSGDSHPVYVRVRSVTNQAIFELPEAPRLPSNAWDEWTQSLIDLERKLDSRLIERYHSLAAGSLAGLTDEEKKRVTTRPQLNKLSLLAVLKEKLGL